MVFTYLSRKITSLCTYLALVRIFVSSKGAARPNSSICSSDRASTCWSAYCTGQNPRFNMIT